MKSGRKILGKLLASEEVPRALQRLKNGDLRSLLIHLDKLPNGTPDSKRGLIHGLAMVELTDRFTHPEQRIL